ncbi:hypothetical protein V493_08143 [Pseudogymnoascus sp. VKM F-4281 (FW-2241)]|nr:hypothetical protein V493_08143 [Pseudogymnoascus sp. VKM F-4281 (FW-2241)]
MKLVATKRTRQRLGVRRAATLGESGYCGATCVGLRFWPPAAAFSWSSLLATLHGIIMSGSNIYNHVGYEESMARVVWAANILYYLVGERNQSQLFPELDEEDFDGDDFDAETENEVVLTGSGDSVRSKFLDCVAELASPSKGWDYVVATGLKESVDSIEIGIARNDGFHIAGGLQSTTSHAKKSNMQYLDHLQKYLASATEESICGQSLTWFDCLAIEYNCERIDYWTASATRCIASLRPFQEDHAEDYTSTFQQAAKMWADLTKLLSYEETGETMPREQIVHSAYQCIASIKVRELLHTIFKSQIGSKLWRILGFIARPVSNCRLLIRIASRLPHFRKVKIIPLLPGPKLKLNPEYLIDITDAWCRLDPAAQPGCELKTLSSFKATFKQDCSRKLSSHAEVQLLSYYVASQLPSIDYFGCSKKSCLLCEGFLQALSRPISTRGRHGICYPAWIVPFTKSEDIIRALQQLEQSLVRQIKTHMKGQPANTFLDQVPQSTIVSDLQSSSLDDISRRMNMMNSEEQHRRMLQRQLRILDGQVPTSRLSAAPIIGSDGSCVMCNSSPAKMSLVSHRPSPTHKLAILFPETDVKPLLTWVPCHRKASSEYEGHGTRAEYETATVRPLLGADDPFPGRIHIEYNPKRDKRLGSGMATWSLSKEGYSIELFTINGVVQ